MSQSVSCLVREINAGATIATLLYAPWPVHYRAAPVRGYTLSQRPARALTYVVEMEWGYGPNALLAQLWALPIDRATEWRLATPGPSGAAAGKLPHPAVSVSDGSASDSSGGAFARPGPQDATKTAIANGRNSDTFGPREDTARSTLTISAPVGARSAA